MGKIRVKRRLVLGFREAVLRYAVRMFLVIFSVIHRQFELFELSIRKTIMAR